MAWLPAKLLVSRGGVDVIFVATIDDAKFVFVHDPFGDEAVCTTEMTTNTGCKQRKKRYLQFKHQDCQENAKGSVLLLFKGEQSKCSETKTLRISDLKPPSCSVFTKTWGELLVGIGDMLVTNLLCNGCNPSKHLESTVILHRYNVACLLLFLLKKCYDSTCNVLSRK